MEKTVLVTGASGNLGREVVGALLAKGHAVRAATRDVSKISSSEGLTAVRFDYAEPATFVDALDGMRGLFLVAPPMDAEAPAKLIPFVERAKEAALDHVVFISALGVDQNEQAPLRVIELALMDSGLQYTILRPNFFMENFSTGFIAPMIKHQRGIFLAAGDGKTSFISTADIADVAATAFSEARYGEEYNLTGPEALDHSQVAKLIGDAIGREVTYHALPEETMLQGARDQGIPEAAVQYMGILYAVVRASYMAVVTDDVWNVTKRKPRSFEDFVKDNIACWE
jgi:uncharacterized protein YbjT (DUF2867 family)